MGDRIESTGYRSDGLLPTSSVHCKKPRPHANMQDIWCRAPYKLVVGAWVLIPRTEDTSSPAQRTSKPACSFEFSLEDLNRR